MDFVVRHVDGYGYLPILIVDGVEKYRGSFRETPQDALQATLDVAAALSAHGGI